MAPHAMGIISTIERQGRTWRLTVFTAQGRRKVAVVEGSRRYIDRALRALASAPAIRALPEDGHRRQRRKLALVGR